MEGVVHTVHEDPRIGMLAWETEVTSMNEAAERAAQLRDGSAASYDYVSHVNDAAARFDAGKRERVIEAGGVGSVEIYCDCLWQNVTDHRVSRQTQPVIGAEKAFASAEGFERALQASADAVVSAIQAAEGRGSGWRLLAVVRVSAKVVMARTLGATAASGGDDRSGNVDVGVQTTTVSTDSRATATKRTTTT
jgi:hypothetical protein